jgi:hypothetical protein
MKLSGVATLLFSITAFGCATTHGAATLADVQPTPIPVVASSMPSVYGVQLRLEGSVAVRDGWLYVVVPTGSVRTYQGTTQAWDLMLRAGLATCTSNGSWRLVSESRAARIAPLVGLTPDSAVLDTTVRAFTDTLRLDLGVPRGTKLERAWLTFELAWPIESTLAAYTLPTSAALAASAEERWSASRGRPADVPCRA